jgi:hypothetical protein
MSVIAALTMVPLLALEAVTMLRRDELEVQERRQMLPHLGAASCSKLKVGI